VEGQVGFARREGGIVVVVEDEERKPDGKIL
jgi:hypothetical protein